MRAIYPLRVVYRQDIQKQTNAAFVFGAYLIVERQFTAAEVHQLLSSTAIPFLAYRDAGYGPNTFGLSLLDCWRGLDAAMQLGFFDLQSFDVEKYEFHEKVTELHWLYTQCSVSRCTLLCEQSFELRFALCCTSNIKTACSDLFAL